MKEPTFEFVSYTGKFPCLCSGILTLKIDGKLVTFGDEGGEDYDGFWITGGDARMVRTEGTWKDGNGSEYPNYRQDIQYGPWVLSDEDLPEHLKPFGQKLIQLFNEHVERGCCGGCL